MKNFLNAAGFMLVLAMSPWSAMGQDKIQEGLDPTDTAMTIDGYGFLRVATVSPKLWLGDPRKNTEEAIKLVQELATSDPHIVVFPEMSLTGYTIGDFVQKATLLDGVRNELSKFLLETRQIRRVIVLGAPWRLPDGGIINAAIVIYDGKIQGIVPKSYLPNYREFQDMRWFRSWLGLPNQTIQDPVFGEYVVGTQQIFSVNGAKFAVEICEDGWAPVAPSQNHALAGAEITLNLSASNGLIGKANKRRELVKQHSERSVGAYVYVSSGPMESSTDLVFDGHQMIAELGSLLAETQSVQPGFLPTFNGQSLVMDIDVDKIRLERGADTTWQASVQHLTRLGTLAPYVHHMDMRANFVRGHTLRQIAAKPFVPNEIGRLELNANEAIALMTAGLARRLISTKSKHIVVGISGGSDSQLALNIAARAADTLGWERSRIIAITMPGFGTTRETKSLAMRTALLLGVTLKDISIVEKANAEFKALDFDPKRLGVTYENVQARARTMLLFDYANMVGGIVLGTGDLSELLVGWCTFGGDHLTSYGVNASVPKTLVRSLLSALKAGQPYQVQQCLQETIDSKPSPELLPPDAQGNVVQFSEDSVGPYAVVDFIGYHWLKTGFTPKKIFYLANRAFEGVYTEAQLRDYFTRFFNRFSRFQFKRSVLPAGPKIGSVSISPRVPFRFPDEISCEATFRPDEFFLPSNLRTP